jgi:DNA-directed RNA polymerase subunit alpha
MDHARIFADFNRKETDTAVTTGAYISDEISGKALADLGLSPRVLNALRSRSIDRVGQVLTMDPDQLLSIRNFGPRSLNELRDKLAEFGYLPEGDVGIFSTEGGYLDALESAMDGDGDDDDSRDVVDAIASLRGDDAFFSDDEGEGSES